MSVKCGTLINKKVTNHLESYTSFTTLKLFHRVYLYKGFPPNSSPMLFRICFLEEITQERCGWQCIALGSSSVNRSFDGASFICCVLSNFPSFSLIFDHLSSKRSLLPWTQLWSQWRKGWWNSLGWTIRSSMGQKLRKILKSLSRKSTR